MRKLRLLICRMYFCTNMQREVGGAPFGSLMAGSALEIDSKEVGEMAPLVKQLLY